MNDPVTLDDLNAVITFDIHLPCCLLQETYQERSLTITNEKASERTVLHNTVASIHTRCPITRTELLLLLTRLQQLYIRPQHVIETCVPDLAVLCIITYCTGDPLADRP